MSAQVKRFPKRPPLTEQQVKLGDISTRLEAIARKAVLVAWALQGVTALEDNDAVWPIQDAAYEIKGEIEAIAEEVTS
jgi:hypothetical protein